MAIDLNKLHFEGVLPKTFHGFRERLARFLFRKAEFDQQSLDYIKEYSEKGAVVYASFQSSNIALFMLYMVMRRHKLPTPSFVLDFTPIILQPIRFLFRRFIRWINKTIFRRKYPYVLDTPFIEETLLSGKSILFPMLSGKVFLRRYLEVKYDSLRYFIDLQRRINVPIFLFPQMIFWNRNPERTNDLFPQSATSNRGFISALLSTSTPSYIRVFQPLNLKEEIERAGDLTSGDIALRLRNKMIEMYQAEKRVVLGPVLRSQQEMIEKVLLHPNVLSVITELSEKNGIAENKLKRKAYRYFREIAADYSVYTIKVFERIVESIFRKVFNGITWDNEGLKMVREAAQKGPIVLTPCHKSHMDYLILSILFFKNQINPPHIAAGANLAFFPVGSIFRRSGAFFLRRTFKGNALYSVVFKQYLKTLVQESYPIEFFIEGGRSRTGRLVYPKLGFLHYLVSAIDENYNKDLVFVPISIGYDRVLEESSYVAEVKGKEKKKETMGAVVKSSKVLVRKHGMAFVTFDKPFTLREIEAKGFTGDARISETANQIIKGINRATSVAPFSLATTAMLLMSTKGFSRESVISRMRLLYDYFIFSGVKIFERTEDPSAYGDLLDMVISSYVKDKIIEEIHLEDGEKLDDMFLIREENRARIAFYKNSISHFLLGASFTALGIIAERKNQSPITIENVNAHFTAIMQLFVKEFIYPDEIEDASKAVSAALTFFQNRGLLSIENDSIILRDDPNSEIVFFARSLEEMLGSYYVVLDVIDKLYKNKIAQKEILIEMRKNGLKQYHLGKIRLPESLSNPNYRSALKKFTDDGLIIEEPINKKNNVYFTKDQVTPRKIRDIIELYLNTLV